MRALQGRSGWQTRQLRHETDKVNTRHLRDERIALRHVPNQRFDLISVSTDVAAKDVSRSTCRRMKTKQCVNERGLAGAIRTKQSNSTSAQLAVQLAQDWAAAESNRQPLQINNWIFLAGRLKDLA